MVLPLLALGCAKEKDSEDSKKAAKEWAEKEIKFAEEKVTGEKGGGLKKLVLEVSMVQGEVAFVKKDGTQETLIQPGMEVRKGSQIKTKSKSQADFKLQNDQFKMRLKENADAVGGSFAYKKQKPVGDLELTKGSVCIQLSKNYFNSFKVKTPSAEITAIGTAFCVEVYGELGDTWIGVVEGSVQVRNLITDQETSLSVEEAAELNVLDGRTEVMYLSEDEAARMRQEIRRIGSGYPEEIEPRVELLIPQNKNRLNTLFNSAAIATNGNEPMRIHRLLMDSLKLMEDGVVEEEKKFLLASIEKLESALLYYKDPRYAPQLLMFIGVYYRNLKEFEKAVETFDSVVRLYPKSALVSLAIAAIGQIYEQDLKEWQKAEEMYQLILEKYADSLDVEEAADGLDRLRTRTYE